jgi:hypothetical protein
MATPISEVIARNTEVLDGVKAILAKAEDTSNNEPTQTETTEEDDETNDDKKDVTREELEALTERVAILEDKMKEKDEQNAKLATSLEASTVALQRVSAFFSKPTNKAMLADGEPIKATVEAGEVKATKTLAEQWLDMPKGKASEAFYKAHEAEILQSL